MRDAMAAIRGIMFSFWHKLFSRNVSIGRNLRIYKKIRLTGKGSLVIGRNCTISGIQGDSSQFTCIDLRSPTSAVIIGDGVSLYAARIAAKFEIRIGDDTIIEEAALIDTDFHKIDRSREDPDNEKYESCKVLIGDRVYIGARSVIMRGVTLDNDVIVLPGSVVVSSFHSNSVVCGNPARCVNT